MPTYYGYRTARSVFLGLHVELGVQLPPRPTIEHVVPRAVFRRPRLVADADMHNFVVYPAHLNSSRGKRRMADERDELERMDELVKDERINELVKDERIDELVKKQDHAGRRCNSHGKPFVPEPGAVRGQLARCVGYVMLRRPDACDLLRSQVLCQRTLVRWAAEHPPTAFELCLDARVAEAQRDEGNPLVRCYDGAGTCATTCAANGTTDSYKDAFTDRYDAVSAILRDSGCPPCPCEASSGHRCPARPDGPPFFSAPRVPLELF